MPKKKTTQIKQKVAELAPPEIGEPSEPLRPFYIGLLAVSFVTLIVTGFLAYPGIMPNWEQRIFSLINGVDLPAWIGSQIASPISDAMPGMLILILIFLLIPRFRWRAWQYAVAAGGAFAGTYVVEHVVGRLRPGEITHEVILRMGQDGYGFPSAHVAIVTALGLTIWPLVQWPWRIAIALFVLAEAWSRVFLGAHAPLDLVGGLAVAGIVVGIIHVLPDKVRLFFRLTPRQQ